MKKLLLCAAIVATTLSAIATPRTKIVAHRGYWDQPGSAQNSIRSLIKADSVGADATEFDVYLTSDDVVVLNHDGVINGYNVSTTSSDTICAQKLENGENLPTLRQFLEVAKDLDIDLVCELKWATTPERERLLAKSCVDLIEEYGLTPRTQYISFSTGICQALAELTDRPVSHLWGEKSTPEQVKAFGGDGCDYSYPYWEQNPEVFKKCRELGLLTNIWTVDDEKRMVNAFKDGFDYLTTNYPEMAQKLRKQTVLDPPCCAKKPKVVAHRGYWKTPGSAQNSIASLVKADSIGADGSEFDVWMTSDGVVVLNHDGVINGLSVQKTPSKIIRKQKLENGENVPTLDEFLKVAKKLNIDLVLEIKVHEDVERENECVKKCVKAIKKYGLEDRTVYISFSKNACQQLAKLTDRPIQFLWGQQWTPQEAKENGCTGCDYNYGVWKDNPTYLPQCRELGMETNIWTLGSEAGLIESINDGFDYLTTDTPVEAIALVNKAYSAKDEKVKDCCKKDKCDKKEKACCKDKK